jgi:hypothetical protein
MMVEPNQNSAFAQRCLSGLLGPIQIKLPKARMTAILWIAAIL